MEPRVPQQFNQIFNRFANISVVRKPLPAAIGDLVIEVPVEVFVPVRNVRRVALESPRPQACAQPAGGGIAELSSRESTLNVAGWAPWLEETDAQGIRVLSARALRTVSLLTITRPDIADELQDYRFVKSGFKLQISSTDGKPLRPQDLVLLAFGTARGELRLACCGCPSS